MRTLAYVHAATRGLHAATRGLAAAAVLSLLVLSAPAAEAVEKTIAITGSGFSPAAVTVAPGTTVVWQNTDTQRHRVRDVDAPQRFDSGNLEPSQSFRVTLVVEGVHRYEDARTGAQGSVTVAAAGGDGGSGGGGAGDGGAGTAPPQTISMLDSRFSPASYTISAGQTVRWINDDDRQHTVTGRTGGFDSGILRAGAAFSHTFPQPGTFSYLCELHSGMTGTITVTGAGGQPPADDQPPPPQPRPTPTPAPTTAQPTPPAPAGTQEVVIRDDAFNPRSVSVTTGTTVRWVNQDAVMHTATASDGSFDSGVLRQGQTFSVQFNRAGSYSYLCELHPEMTASITVTGESSPGGNQAGPGSPSTAPAPSSPSGGTQPSDGPRSPGGGRESATVTMTDNAFSPATVQVDVGGTVSWVHKGRAIHTVTDAAGSFDSGMLRAGVTWRRTFTQPGTFNILCVIHPEMTGAVIVRGADGTAPPPARSTPRGVEGGAMGPGNPAVQGAAGGAAPAAAPGAATVTMQDNRFDPPTVAVRPGGTVTWVNGGRAAHTATAKDGSFDSKMVSPGGRFSRNFPSEGTFPYVCSLHPGMTGVVRVQQQAAPTSAAAALAEADASGPGVGGGSMTLRGPDAEVIEPEAAPAAADVEVVDFDFLPDVVVVRRGGEVTWRFTGQAPHTATAEDGSFDSGIQEQGAAFTQTFDEVGYVPYLCSLHPDMVGVVQVVDEPEGDPEAAAAAGSGGGSSSGASGSGSGRAPTGGGGDVARLALLSSLSAAAAGSGAFLLMRRLRPSP
jgi:plastocyanin